MAICIFPAHMHPLDQQRVAPAQDLWSPAANPDPTSNDDGIRKLVLHCGQSEVNCVRQRQAGRCLPFPVCRSRPLPRRAPLASLCARCAHSALSACCTSCCWRSCTRACLPISTRHVASMRWWHWKIPWTTWTLLRWVGCGNSHARAQLRRAVLLNMRACKACIKQQGKRWGKKAIVCTLCQNMCALGAVYAHPVGHPMVYIELWPNSNW